MPDSKPSRDQKKQSSLGEREVSEENTEWVVFLFPFFVPRILFIEGYQG